ncbi:MAG: phosphatase PAP2 family protein [Flavisolibacter sp.]
MKKAMLFAVMLVLFLSSYAQNDSLPSIVDTSVQSPDTNFHFQAVAITPHNAEVYHIKPGIDIPLTVGGVGWSLYAFTKIYNKDTSTLAQIMALNRNNVSRFNRSAIDQYSQTAFDNSNIFFYGSMPLPLILLLDKKIRKDALKIGFLYLEAMGITGFLYTGSVYFHDKYRPYAYNSNTPLVRRLRGGAKNSFFAGHVALVGTSTFFIAKVLSDYHPESKIKWLLYTLAAGATGTTGYLRYKAGEHFPTDVLLGVGIGTLTGILVPHFHKNKRIKDADLTIVPTMGSSNGLSLVYKF